MDHNKKRVLVVDDEPSITRLLKLNLEQTEQYIVETENNAAHALAAARDFHPDVILMDVLMPGIGGGELASRFQESSTLKDVPIVFLTAAATKHEVLEHHGVIGGLPFLAKPVDIPEVIDCLRRQVGT